MKRSRFSRGARLTGLALAAALCCAAGVCHALSCIGPFEVATLELVEISEDGAAGLYPPLGTQATLTGYANQPDLTLSVSGVVPARDEVYLAAP